MPSVAPNMLMIRRALNGERAVYSIAKHPKLYLAADGKGGGSWRIKYRPAAGATQRWVTLSNDARNASFDDIARKASELLTGLSLNGIDPRATRKSASRASFDATFRDWLERHGKVRKKSWQHDESLYERHIKARIAHDDLRAITRARVIEVLNDIADKATPLQANRCQSLISAVLSWALDEGRIDIHPALRIRHRGEEKRRELVMTSDQLKQFWTELNALRDNSAVIIKLLLLLGGRLSEVTGARHRELDLDSPSPTWTVPGERTKNGLGCIVPLPARSVELLLAACGESIHRQVREEHQGNNRGRLFVFPARRIEPTAFDGNHVSRQVKEIFRKIGVPDMRLHDLRHQAATGMAQCGVPMDIRMLVQNQVSGRRATIGSVYDQHDYSEEKRRALTLWEERLLAIVEGRPIPDERY